MINTAQAAVLMVMNHDTVFGSWYRFNVSVSPMREIANFTQVILNQQLQQIV